MNFYSETYADDIVICAEVLDDAIVVADIIDVMPASALQQLLWAVQARIDREVWH